MKKSSSVALVATFSAVVALAPSANATTVSWPPVPFSGGDTVAGATFMGTSVGGGSGEFTFASPMTNMWTASLNFNPGYNSGGVTQEFKYTLSTTNGNPFTAVGLTSQMQAGLPGGNFGKKVCTDGYGTGTCLDLSTINTASDNPDGTLKPLVGFGSTIYVIDTYNTTNGTAQITGITNTFKATPPASVPGPLPLLGVSAAFGFSRKLRKRILQSV
jgi:hypothetical protein